LDAKYRRLEEVIRKTGGMAVAFSGGVDSTFLAAVAVKVLGDKALAITALSPTYPAWEQKEALELAEMIGIRHVELASHELDDPHFVENPADRCYYCKKELVDLVQKTAAAHGLHTMADGTTTDDLCDHRPGRRAAREGGMRSPLLEAEMTKDDVRTISRRMGLPTADKPSLACLASRIPYGTRITPERLHAVDQVETVLRELGFKQLRVRHHGEVARIEVEVDSLAKLCRPEIRARVVAAAKAAGFTYVAVDLDGYRTGSMNAVLSAEEHRSGAAMG
jgi:uncharacterized protein